MKFWDSSALVPLCLKSGQTKFSLGVFTKDPVVVAWCLTLGEIWSALCRQEREKRISSAEFRIAKVRARELSDTWTEVIAIAQVRERALRLMETHGLKSADSLQLASALVAAGEEPRRFGFVCLDEKLSRAAAKEGFAVLSP